MASIRRTLSPYHDRPRLNGDDPFSLQPPAPKGMSNAKISSPLMTLSLGVRRIFAGNLFQKSSRKSLNSLKHSFYRCLALFLLGFLLGMAPFGKFEDASDQVQSRDYSFERKITVDPVESVKIVERPEVDFVMDTVELRSIEIEGKKDGVDLMALKQLIVVTPTYNRALQAYFLHRLGQVLRLVRPPVLWIVVEMNTLSLETADILRKTGVVYRHLVCVKNLTNIKDRGVQQRNTALEHIEHHKLDGIVYFADDDNIYTVDLFESMREIRRFGTWPVAMLAQSKAKAILEGPVCNGSQVIGWHTNEKSKRLRRFHVDMSGFAFNSTILWDSKRFRRPTSAAIRQLDTVKEGFQETTFIEQIVEDENQMEGIPFNCSRVLNWHLHLEARELIYPEAWQLSENLDAVIPLNG